MTTIARVNFYGVGAQIVQNYWASVQPLIRKMNELKKEHSTLEGDTAGAFYYEQIASLEMEIDTHFYVIIIFSAIAIEGYIYDYAARKLTENFADEIDKLDTMGKLLVIPQLATGKPFPKDGKAYQLLKQLISDRNYLVHTKSAPLYIIDERDQGFKISQKSQRLGEFGTSLQKKALNAIQAIEELALAIEQIDENEPASSYLRVLVGRRKVQFDTYGV